MHFRLLVALSLAIGSCTETDHEPGSQSPGWGEAGTASDSMMVPGQTQQVVGAAGSVTPTQEPLPDSGDNSVFRGEEISVASWQDLLDDYIRPRLEHFPKFQGQYRDPSGDELDLVAGIVTALVEENFGLASDLAPNLGMKLFRFAYRDSIHYLLVPEQDSNFRFMFGMKPGPRDERAIQVVQSIHPEYDGRTTKNIVVRTFLETDVPYMLLSGQDRRNACGQPGCLGATTTMCGDLGTYKPISDSGAHWTTHVNWASKTLADLKPTTYFMQIHGMGSYEGAIVSSGSTSTSFDEQTYQGAFALCLSQLADGAGLCGENTIGLEKKTGFCGSSNPLGRYLRGSSDPCSQGGNKDSLRFTHAEINDSLKDDPSEIDAISECLGDVYETFR